MQIYKDTPISLRLSHNFSIPPLYDMPFLTKLLFTLSIAFLLENPIQTHAYRPISHVLSHALKASPMDEMPILRIARDIVGNEAISDNELDDEIVFEMLPLIKVYKSGRVERLCGTDTVPASFDRATKVISKDVTIDTAAGITARLYLPTAAMFTTKLPILVYFHGGSFLIESAFSPTYHPHLNNLASLGPVLAVSVNYRLAPEHPLPAAYEDSWAALQWVFSRKDLWLAELGDFDRLYIAGDSAGGNICQQMAARAGEEGIDLIKGMALVDSYFWGEEPVGTESWNQSFRADMKKIWLFLYPGTTGLDDPRLNPLAETAPSLTTLGCRRVLVVVAEYDILWNRGMVYYEKLKSSGWRGDAELINTPVAEHDFHIFHPDTDKAMAVTKKLAAFFAQ